MELRHLRYFVAVAEELHFGRAARRLGIAQPPLSQQIKALEEEIGAVFLKRTKRQVDLTAAGRVFLIEARKTLAQAEQAVRAAQRAARGEIGQLSVGFVCSAVYGKVPSIFRLMRSRYPEVSLLLQELTSEEQVEAMKKNEIDIGLIRPPLQAAESLAWAVPFFIQPVVAVFYPVSVLPAWLRPVAMALPATHIFEGMRAVMQTGTMSWAPLCWAFALNLVYLALAGGFFVWILNYTRKRGLLTKFSTQ